MVRLRSLILGAVLLGGASAAAESLDIQGTVYPSTCEAEAWQTLAAELRAAAGRRAPEKLIALVQPYLCGSDGRAAEIVLRAAPSMLVLTSEGTGEPTTRRRVKSREALEPRGGQVWNASVYAKADDVTVNFFINEACVHGVTFRAVKSAWRVQSIGEACD